MKDCFQLPEFELIFDSLGYTISVYGWLLPEDHELYTRSLRSINNVTVYDLIRDIGCQLICPGVYPKELTGDTIRHVTPKVVDPLYSDDESGFDVFPKKQFCGLLMQLLCSPNQTSAILYGIFTCSDPIRCEMKRQDLATLDKPDQRNRAPNSPDHSSQALQKDATQ
ncbi:hypothetical protein ACROYT_G012456 [Oculina patagonica]